MHAAGVEGASCEMPIDEMTNEIQMANDQRNPEGLAK
jgi:hypothetical protein